MFLDYRVSMRQSTGGGGGGGADQLQGQRGGGALTEAEGGESMPMAMIASLPLPTRDTVMKLILTSPLARRVPTCRESESSWAMVSAGRTVHPKEDAPS